MLSGSVFLIIGLGFLVIVGFSIISFSFYVVAPPGRIHELNQEAEFLEQNCDKLEHDESRFQCIESLIKVKKEILTLERDPIILSALESDLIELESYRDLVLKEILKPV